MNLQVDKDRVINHGGDGSTGIYVRACHKGSWGSFDTVELTKESLLEWLRSRPNCAEQTVFILLGHPHWVEESVKEET